MIGKLKDSAMLSGVLSFASAFPRLFKKIKSFCDVRWLTRGYIRKTALSVDERITVIPTSLSWCDSVNVPDIRSAKPQHGPVTR
jgi:hypothetical protein